MGPRCQDLNIDKFLKIKEKDFLSILSPVYKAIKKQSLTSKRQITNSVCWCSMDINNIFI